MAKRNEKEPEDSGQLSALKAALDHGSDAALVTRVDSVSWCDSPIVHVNPAFAALFGYGPAEALGRSPRIIQGAKTDASAYAKVQAAIATGNAASAPVVVYALDGRALDVDLAVWPVRDARGKVTWAGATLRIKSEHFAADESLRIAAERLASFSEIASDWLWETDEQLRFTWASANRTRATRSMPEDYLGKTREEVAGIDPNDPHWSAHLADLAARRPFRDFRYALTSDDDKVEYVQVSGKPFYDAHGGFLGYRGVGSNVTHTVEAELAANKAREMLSRAIEGLSEIFALFDADDRLVIANRACRELNAPIGDAFRPGVRFADYLNAGIAVGMFPDALGREAEWLRWRMEQHLRATEPFEVLRQDGHCLLVRETRLQGGSRVTVSTDITEFKRIQSALIQAKDAAEKANLAKSRFLAAASHDLRQPLQSLTLLASSLPLAEHKSEQFQIAKDIQNALQVMENLLASLSEIARLDSGLVKPLLDEISIATLLRRMAIMFAPVAKARRIELRVIESNATVRTDPTLLQRVIQNLIANAINYTDKGKVLVGCIRYGTMLRVMVADTGRGIPADKLDSVFEEFYQLENPGRDRSRGMGLGLAIVDRLGRILDHRVAVRSRLGKGTTFCIDVPLAASPALGRANVAGATAPSVPSRQARGHASTILLIEDDALVARATRKLLELWGYRTIVATTAQAAIDRAQELAHELDLILADYRLGPGPSGATVVQGIRKLSRQSIPAIVITGDDAPEVLRQVAAADCRLMFKPVDADALKALIDQMAGAARDEGRSRVS